MAELTKEDVLTKLDELYALRRRAKEWLSRINNEIDKYATKLMEMNNETPTARGNPPHDP